MSIVNLKDLLVDNDNKRIDSEYFKKQFLQFFKDVPNLRPLGSLAKDGYRVVYENTKIIDKAEALEQNFPIFLQATDLETPFIKTSNLYYVDNEQWERYPKGRITKGEILIEVKGKIDKVAIVPDDFPEKTLVTGSLFKLTVNENISKNVLLTYLISKFGVAFKDRYKTNLLISFVSKPDLYRIPVPSFSKKFEGLIDNLFTIILKSQKNSKEYYNQAEALLLQEIGIPPTPEGGFRGEIECKESLNSLNVPAQGTVIAEGAVQIPQNECKEILKIICADALDQYGKIKYNYELTSLAKENRKNPTKAEKRIWDEFLSNKQTKYKFKQQKPIMNFIADFYCSELLLIVEIDGDYHSERKQKQYDEIRTEELNKFNIEVLRYTNDQILNNFEYAKNDLLEKLEIRAKYLNSLINELKLPSGVRGIPTSPLPISLSQEPIRKNLFKSPLRGLGGDGIVNYSIKSFSESFLKTGRLDAEYYQKKYEQIIKIIKSQKYDSLCRIVDISKSIEPGSNHYSDEEGLPFYRVSDYNKFGLSKPDKELTTSFVAENKDLIEKLKPKKGTILFSKDGSVGTAFLLRNNLEGITSGAILHLQIKNTKEILPEYLTLALNSKLVQMQAERDAGGSIILHWRKEEIEQVVVPMIDFKKQVQIAELVEESFKLKVESERLLEVAKQAVEMAIEVDEETAIKYINDNTI